MSGAQPLDPVGARIVDRLHASIASLIDGNHAVRSEVVNVDARACPCRLIYEVEWSFVSHTSERRAPGNGAVSTHFGYDRRGYDRETGQRCETGRTHQPIREGFVAQMLGNGGAALGDAGSSIQIWDFGQHSVHVRCARCRGKGQMTCSSCHGSRSEICYRCFGQRTTTETRWVTDSRGHGHNETHQQACYACGASGRVTCRPCNGSGDVRCSDCAAKGFFTDIMSVTVQAEPHVRVATRSALSKDALSDYLVKLPVSQVVRYLDFTPLNHQETSANTWQVGYEVHTTVAELDLRLRAKTYMAAAVGDKALAFVRPPIFDDLFSEEVTHLNQIGAGKKKAFSYRRARKFFAAYAGQPVLDAAMKSVAKLAGQERERPSGKVTDACDGYISNHSANLLGIGMTALLDKVSPPHSLGAWLGVMALPFILLFLGAQNWLERNAPANYSSMAKIWLLLALTAVVVTAVVSPLAAAISAVVSAIRRRAVSAAYRQHGRNWQPFKPFVLAAVAWATLGAGLGALSHHGKLLRWDNAPMDTIERALNLHRFTAYAQASARLKQAGLFVSTRPAQSNMTSAVPMILSIQGNLHRLGYKVPVNGQMDDATQRAIAAYVRKRKLASTSHHLVLASLCQDLRGACSNVSSLTGSP